MRKRVSVTQILKSKRGVSLIFVLCIMLLLLTIGASVLVSASNTASSAKAGEDSVVRERYVREMSEYFNSNVVQKAFTSSGIDETSPFYKIPQKFYEKNEADVLDGKSSVNKIAITQETPSSGGNVSINTDLIKGMNVTMQTKLVDQKAKLIVPYQAAVVDPTDSNVILVPEILGTVEVTLKMSIEFTANYGKEDYTIISDYAFEGQVTDIKPAADPTAPKNKISNGEWTLLGYRQLSPLVPPAKSNP